MTMVRINSGRQGRRRAGGQPWHCRCPSRRPDYGGVHGAMLRRFNAPCPEMDTWVSSLATLVAFVALVLFLVPTVIALLLLLGSGGRLAVLLLFGSRTRLSVLLPLCS